MAPFSKFELKGENAHEQLQKLCTANVKNEIGKCTYTQMLNPDGGIEADLTIVCLDKNYFRIISSAATRERDKYQINKYLPKKCEKSRSSEPKSARRRRGARRAESGGRAGGHKVVRYSAGSNYFCIEFPRKLGAFG